MAPKFNNFHSKDFVYKTVNGHPIEATVSVPKNVAPGKLPVLVHLHGGGLFIGDKRFEDWIALWLIQFAESKGAIVVSPNYRLLPEANGDDIVDDLASLYDWIRSSLDAEVTKISSNAGADLTKLLVAGESAGGYLAALSVLRFPELNFAACISEYGMLDVAHPHFSKAYYKPMHGAPDFPESTVDDYLKTIQPGAVRTSTLPLKLWDVVVVMQRQGRLLEFLGEDKRFNPLDLLDEVKVPPPFWLLQGKQDELVVPGVCENFVNKMKKTHPGSPLHYSLQDGGHGFDCANTVSDEWVREGCDFISKYWP